MNRFFKQDFCEQCDFVKAHTNLNTSISQFDCSPHTGKCTARTVYAVRIKEDLINRYVSFEITKIKRHWKEGLLPKDSQIESLGNKHYTYYRDTYEEADEIVNGFANALQNGYNMSFADSEMLR